MTEEHGPAFAFWLNYVESRGGLWERSGDTVLAILPGTLSTEHDLPETALITDDPDIAREDGVLFLGAGHPEIDKGARAVVDSGDVGALALPHSAKAVSTEDLVEKIRDQVPVEHGRIDATGSVLRSHRPLLRLGALVSHTVSADERFTEVAECLVDIASRVAWPRAAANRLLSAMATDGTPARPTAATSVLAVAVGAAHRELDAAAARRGRELAADAAAERTAEMTRATEYYAAALAAIDKRRGGADGQRGALLDARAEATTHERDRRLAEIDEKYRHQHALRPYRMHLVDVPVLRLATDVRRGDRRWPVVFDYVPLLGTVAPTRCPACDAHSPLVASKTHLGCETCIPTAAPVRPVPVQPAPVEPAAATGKRPVATSPAPTAAAPAPAGRETAAVEQPKRPPAPRAPVVVSAPPRPALPARPFLPGKPEERRVVDFWNHVSAGDTRKMSRLIAPDSPLAALTRLYGADGPLAGAGVPAGHGPTEFTLGNYDRPVAGQRGGTAGELRTHLGIFQYLLLWSPDKRLDEIYPYSQPWHLGRATMFVAATPAPPTRVDLDPVARLLFTRTPARHGLTFAARALAAWWRLPDPDALLARFSPRVIAGALDRAIRYWSGAAGAGYPEAAEAFRADEADMRKATPVMQRRLRLSDTCNW